MLDWGSIVSGGLAGALLGPLTSYGLDRLRVREARRKNHERQLRRMVEQEIEWGRSLIAASKVIAARRTEKGYHPPFQERLSILNEAGEQAPSWQNYRISDKRLRRMAEDYLREARTVRSLLLEGPSPVPGEPPYGEELNGLRELERLEPEIVARMDKLTWPTD